ncbi:choice-of-anchor G family protein [Pseudarthrobacter sp. NamB4]|uniref:choice-of-anchor G family protein n=1 Tax=Pseudarthrobacter sp. NamB4 TaxID=2576837 RepID=UPI001485B262|nr:choice-of-anchor G family protein [Pseudarthrobacter sp. NamB4]
MKLPDRLQSGAIVAGILAVAVAVCGTALTDAAWVDNEYVHTSAGTDGRCESNSGIASSASAREVSGSLLGTDLANIASVNGVSVTNDGAGTSSASPGAIQIDDNTFKAPLDLDLLRADLLRLTLPLGLPVGAVDVYSQWSQTLNNGNSTAAAGLITDSGGALGIGQAQNPADPPVMAALDLGALAPESLAGMTLEIGAASSLAGLTQCGGLGNGWQGPLAQPQIHRSYGIAALDLKSRLPALGTAASEAGSLVDGVQTSVTAATATVESAIAKDLTAVATSLLGDLRLGSVSTKVTMSQLDPTPVRELLRATMTDSKGLLTVDFGTGHVHVDLAKTTGGINGLNGRAPNTHILLDQTTTAELSTALTQVLGEWKNQIVAAITAAVRSMSVTVEATVQVHALDALALYVPAADINLGLGPVPAGRLMDLHAGISGTGPVPVSSSIDLLGAVNPPTATLDALASGLAAALPDITGRALNHELILGVAAKLESSLGSSLMPVAPALAAGLDRLNNLLSIMVNVQPDQPGYPLPATGSPYSVSALRLSFDSLDTLHLSLATSSVGYGS